MGGSSAVPAVGQWFRPEEAAEYLRISRRTIYKLIGQRDILPCKIGKVTLLGRADLDRYVESKRVHL